MLGLAVGWDRPCPGTKLAEVSFSKMKRAPAWWANRLVKTQAR